LLVTNHRQQYVSMGVEHSHQIFVAVEMIAAVLVVVVVVVV
jgi:hypothetical protein